MIQANELRIGNRVNYFGNHPSFDGAFNEEFARYMFDVKDEWELLNPIPLTEEWLLKFWFEKKDNIFLLNDFKIELEESGDFQLVVEGIFLKEITKVHHLQNLYFALTGEELTIKESQPA